MKNVNDSHVRTVTGFEALLVAGVVAGSALTSGCSTYSPGGSGFSDDAFTFQSTEQVPQSVTLVDTRTGQTLWTYEVPVGRQVTVRFERDINPDNTLTPDEMYWEEMEIGTHHGYLDNSMLVPSKSGRRLDVAVRPAPEMPATATAPNAAH